MCEILIFGGTTEGRELVAFCDENKIRAYVSVATDYGENLLGKSEYITVLNGRMNEYRISAFIEENGIKTVVDATHPYAVEVSENIKKACLKANIERIRIKRSSGEFFESAKYFDNTRSLVDYLNSTRGKILITTGSKELQEYCKVENFSKRCAVRILPCEENIGKCLELGFSPDMIIAEKGPFSKEKNVIHMKKFSVDYLVTKESGRAGGFEEKIRAAAECSAVPLVIKRPKEQGISFEEAKLKLMSLT